MVFPTGPDALGATQRFACYDQDTWISYLTSLLEKQTRVDNNCDLRHTYLEYRLLGVYPTFGCPL